MHNLHFGAGSTASFLTFRQDEVLETRGVQHVNALHKPN
jgi:hypothetical protein